VGARWLKRVACGTAFALALLAARAGGAQAISGFAIDRFEPAGADSPWMTAEALTFDDHVRPFFAAAADWAWKPLVFYGAAGQGPALVRQQAVMHVDAALVMWKRARFDLALPLPVVNTGDDVQIRADRYAAPRGWGLGDLRVGGDVRVLGGARDAFRAGVGAWLFVPTGGTRRFTGDGGVRFWPRLQAAGERARFSWAASFGLHLRPSGAGDLAPGHELTFGAAAGFQATPRVLLGGELAGSKALSSTGVFAQADAPVELLLAGHLAVAPRWRVSLGIAPGLTNGPGTPAVRGVLGVQYQLPPPPASELPASPPPW
jgi:hypothetical protein